MNIYALQFSIILIPTLKVLIYLSWCWSSEGLVTITLMAPETTNEDHFGSSPTLQANMRHMRHLRPFHYDLKFATALNMQHGTQNSI